MGRLEEIKERIKNDDLETEDFNWLIARVEKLERNLEHLQDHSVVINDEIFVRLPEDLPFENPLDLYSFINGALKEEK